MELVLNRKKFRQYWNSQQPGLGDDDSVLWAYEQHVGTVCRWFVKVPAVSAEDFWPWSLQNLRGSSLCYSSDGQEQWWGFTHRDDIFLFLLKWS